LRNEQSDEKNNKNEETGEKYPHIVHFPSQSDIDNIINRLDKIIWSVEPSQGGG